MIRTEKDLFDYIDSQEFDAIVIEGYDGVGKGNILNKLSEHIGIIPYRPDYNLWSRHNIDPKDRWKISGFFWDIYSHFDISHHAPLLFDRGCISGAAYNGDMSIADTYVSILRDMYVLHVVVICDYDDFMKFQKARDPLYIECEDDWISYLKITANITESLKEYDLPYVLYLNEFSQSEFDRLSHTCEGCGHYNYGICRHPEINRKVDATCSRCEKSLDKETQDRDVTEMQCV